ncbi:MAG: PEP-CTERM sorting domain-containing protein [Planctomycetota bacterium]
MNNASRFFVPSTLAVGLLACAVSSHATVTGVAAPDTRGDLGTGFIQFDKFNAGTSPVEIGNADTFASGGGVTGDVTFTSQPLPTPPFSPFSSPGGIIPAGLTDNRFYHHFWGGNWGVTLNNPGVVENVLLQLKVLGPGTGSPVATIAGNLPTNSVLYDDGDGNAIAAFYWEDLSPIAANAGISIDLELAPFGFSSFDSFTIDISDTAIGLVPEPASLVLLGLGGSVVLLRRRRA